MKLATWNVNSVKARLPILLDWLDANSPDVVMLQEIKTLELDIEPFRALGYDCNYVGQKSYNGVATLSKTGGTEIERRLPGDDSDEQSRYLAATINGVRVINIYLPNGNPIGTEKFTYKLAWMQRLRAELQRLLLAEIPFLVGGDFNVIPENADCYDPKAWLGDALFQPETRQLWRSMLHLGLTDAFRALDQRPGQFTFWDYQAGAWRRNAGIRIDHFLLSPKIADRLQSCTIDKEPRALERASDHTPVLLTIGD